MASKDIRCSVGEFVNSDCFKESYIKFAVQQNLIALTELPKNDQRIIKLRVGSDFLTTICSHHHCVYMSYFQSIFKPTKNCCDLKNIRKP